jgi:hypothetical protein
VVDTLRGNRWKFPVQKGIEKVKEVEKVNSTTKKRKVDPQPVASSSRVTLDTPAVVTERAGASSVLIDSSVLATLISTVQEMSKKFDQVMEDVVMLKGKGKGKRKESDDDEQEE